VRRALVIILAGAAALVPLGAGSARAQDETALRVYAGEGRRDRAEAEIRRLKASHPGWQPPADLWTTKPGGPDEAPLWRLFSANRLDELDAAIAQRRRAEPGWQPSTDLAGKLASKRLRTAVLAAAGEGRWQEAGRAAAGFDPGAADPELAWAVAEARARTGAPVEAAAVYASLLAADLPSETRRTTVLKSLSVLPIRMIDDLLASVRKSPAALDLEPIRGDLVRARASAIMREEDTRDLTLDEVALFRDEAMRSGEGPALSLVAWYEAARQNPAEAVEWFRRSLAAAADPVVAHGLAQALVRVGQRDEARDVAFAWSDRLANNAILFVDLVGEDLMAAPPGAVASARLDQMAGIVLRTASGDGAQALGWYAWNACDAAAALPWFERAVAWHPREGAVLGLGLALQRLGRRKDAAELANRYDGLFPQVVRLVMRQAAGGADRCSPMARAAMAPRPLAPTVPLPGQSDGTSFLRGEYPVAVAAENLLRFEAGQAGRRSLVKAPGGLAPRVARRVGGVGPMPYEAAGMTLLPGWAGQDSPAPVAAARVSPAPGTRWESLRPAARAGAAPGIRQQADGARFAATVTRP
jgi:tetratricopeptide (TPR) repeat protein